MADKRISQLNTHTSPSGSDLLVIVNNNETKKITYADLKDSIVINSDNALLNAFSASYLNDSASFHTRINAATNEQDLSAYVTTLVVNTLSSSVDGRLDSLEGSSGSYLTTLNGAISSSSQLTSSYDERYVLSGSITQTTWDNISGKPDGLVSQSVDISNFTFTSETITNQNVTIVASDGDIVLNADGNVYKGSSNAGNGFVTDGYLGGVIGDTNRVNNSTGNTITDNLDGIINSIPSISSLNTFTSSQEVLNNTFATTGSNTFIGNQTINGSVTILTPSAGVPNGVSNWNGGGGWNQGLYSNLATTGGTGTGLTVNVVTDGSGYIDINSITINTSGSGYTNGDVITIDNENNIPGTFTISIEQGSGWEFNISGSLITPGDINVSGSIYANNLTGLLSSSQQILDLGFVTGSYTTINEFNNLTQSFNSISQSFTTISSSVGGVDFNGLISGSSQLTSSYDLRYAPSASYLTSLNGAFSSSIQTLGSSGVYSSSAQLPVGLISGSSQLTSSYDTRYALSSSVSSISSSFNSRFNGLVTTGSNTFSGSQIFSGSMTVTSGQVVASTITNNSSSLYLQSGSNLYVQNNGVVEITGSLRVSGSANFNVDSLNINGRSGDEGGEINLAVPETNTTLSTRVVVDIYRDRLRIFDGNTKGVYVDLSKAPTGVNGELTWKVSGYVDAGTFVQLDNIKATVTTSGNRGLSIGAVSTNFTANIGGTFSNSAGAGGNSSQNIAYTTTASTSVFGWNFIAEGDTSTYIINDKTNSRMYRITMMIGPAYLGNFISIERLH